jgi:peptide deformylase
MRLPVRQYGDPILRAKGKRIEKLDDRIRELAQNMIETMHAANGVGLAAQQVGEPLQLTVLDVSQVEDRPSTMRLNGKDVDPKTAMPLILLNPQLTLGRETGIGTEGCLSFPEITGEIERSESVMARAETLEGELIEVEATGLLARALQHEVDHLNGILFIDRMSSAAKAGWASRLKRMQKETQRSQGRDARSLAGQSAL